MSKKIERQPRPIIEALEPKLLFSAVADIAVFDDGQSDVNYLSHSASEVDLTHVYLNQNYLNHIDSLKAASESTSASDGDESITPDLAELSTTALADPDREYLLQHSLVFVDKTVADYQQLVQDILNNPDNQSVEIIYLHPDKNGVEQITEALRNYSGISAIHLISHGKNGALDLGNQTINNQNVDDFAEEFSEWKDALAADADILIYGCDVGSNTAGLQLIEKIANYTDADIAASSDLTGHSFLGGDWELEIVRGDIEARVIVSEIAQQNWEHILGVFETSGTSTEGIGVINTSNAYQSFVDNDGSGTYNVNSISVQLRQNPFAIDQTAQTITVSLISGSYNGTVLASATTSSTTLATALAWKSFSVASVALTYGQTYFIKISSTGTNSDPLVYAGIHNSNVYNGGTYLGNSGSADSSRDLAFEVAGTNATPIVANAIPNQNATEDSAFSYQFATNTFADADAGTTLTYTAQLSGGGALPSWLSFNSATRTFSGTPLNTNVGTLNIDVTANDGNGGTVTDTFAITVANTNDAPTVANAIPNQNATEDSAFTYQFASNTFADVDAGTTLTYTAQLSGGGALPSWLSFNSATRTFSGTPLNANVGTVNIDVIASDGAASVTDTFAIAVANTNDAPTVANAIPNQNATEDSAFTYQFASNTFADVDASTTLTYTAQLSGGGALPSWLSFNSATRTFSGTPLNTHVGTVNIDVIASDGTASVTDTFAITVANTNDAPTVANAIPNQSATEDSAFNYQFASNTFADVDAGATLTYTAQLSGGGALPSWLNFNSATRTFSGTPLNANVGTINIDVVASDGNGGAITDTFALAVTNTNDAPNIANAIPNQSATEDSPFSYQFASNTFADVDVGATLTYSAQLAGGGSLPAWLSFNTGTRTFSGTPLNADVGTLSIDVIANDGNGGTVTDTFNITVANSNDAPTLANAISDQNATEDSAFNFQFASNTFNDVDAGTTFSYSAQLSGGGALPSWLTFNSATRTFSGIPLNANVGTINIDVTASDGSGGTVSDTFALTVANTNDAPTVANALPDQNVVQSSGFNFVFAANTFSDQDAAATLTYTAQLSGGGALPAWLNFNAGTRTFSGTPGLGDVGTSAVEVTASDGNGGTVSDTFNLIVTNITDVNYINTGTQNQQIPVSSVSVVGQSFAYVSGASTYAVNEISLQLARFQDAVAQTITVELRSAWNGAILGSDTISSSQISDTGFEWHSFNFSNVSLNDSQTYYVQITSSAADDRVLVGRHNSDIIPGGAFIVNGVLDAAGRDLAFKISLDDGANTAPAVANPITDTVINTEAPFNYVVPVNTFADANINDTIIYRAQLAGGGSLDWLQFNEITRTFSGTPHYHQIGTLQVELIATDNHGASVSEFFDVTTVNANTVANPIADQIVAEGSSYSFTFAVNTFDNANGHTLTYTALQSNGSALPGWLAFNGATRTFSGMADDGDVGIRTIRVTANDGFGGIVSDTFDITINNVQEAPFIDVPIPDQAATGFVPFSYTFGANVAGDPDIGDTLTYTAQLSGGGALPSWLTYNSTTRTFSGTPTNAEAGTVAIDVIATDSNGGTATDTFNLVVGVGNAPPVNTVPSAQSTNEDIVLTFSAGNGNQIQIADADAGGNSVEVTLSVTNGSLTLASVAGLSFTTGNGANNATMIFTGTVANINSALSTLTYNSTLHYSGADTLTLITNDLGSTGAGIAHSDTDMVAITVNSISDAPVVANAISDQNATEDTAFNFTFASNTFSDVDAGDTFTYTTQLNGGGALPSWLNFNAATRTFSGTPTNADVGTVSVRVIATDSASATGFEVFDIVIADTNDAPTLANAIPDQSATEDSAFNFTFASNTFDDTDTGDILIYSAQLSGGGALPAWLSFDSLTRNFSGTPTNADLGTISVEVTADDGNGGVIADVFNIVIANSNDAPTVANAIPDQSATEDSAFNFTLAANTFNDVDIGDILTYTAQLNGGGALPSWLSFNATTGTFSGTPTNGDIGTLTIDVTVSDGNGGIITDTFDLVITNINDAPVVANAIATQLATEDALFNFTFPVNTFTDADVGDTLSYSAQLFGGGALPSWLTFNPGTRTFSGVPANSDVGTITVELVASDGNGGTVSDTFDIVIANTNDAPTVANPIPNQAAIEDAAFNFTFPPNTFSDVDAGDTLTYTAQLNGGGALPSWLSFNAATRTFSGTPANADVGTVTIEVIADDGTATIADTFNMVVANANDAPMLANAMPDQSVTEDSTFNFTFASNTFNDTDIGDTLTYSAQLSGGGALPAWLSFNAATRTFSGTPTNSDVGTLAIDVTASDGNGGAVSGTFGIVIANTNDAPTVANPIPNQTAIEDAAFNFTFSPNTFFDVDVGNTLTYTAQLNGGGALPSWLNFNAATGTFSGSPTNNDIGIIAIDVTASDSNGGVVTDTFDIIVANVNDAPVVANPVTNQLATEDSVFNFTFPLNTFSDTDVGDTLTYSAQLSGGGTLPTWLTFNATTRTFSGMPTNSDVGTLSVDVIASDGTATITDTFNIVVANTNDSPILVNSLSDQSVPAGSAYNFVFPANTFTDPDVGDAFTYTASLQNGNPLPVWLSFNSSTGAFTGTPTSADIGSVSIRITALDQQGASAITNVQLNVIGPAPIVVPIPPIDLTEDVTPQLPVITPPSVGIDVPEDANSEDDNTVIPPKNDNSIVEGGGNEIISDPTPTPLITADADIKFSDDEQESKRSLLDRIANEKSRQQQLSNSVASSGLLASLITPSDGFNTLDAEEFNNELRKFREQMDNALEKEQQQRAVFAGITLSVTTGILIWILRASSLLFTLMSMLPLWRGIDPLPILDEVNKRKKELEQQRRDRKKEDKTSKEVGYLFDRADSRKTKK